MDESKLQRFIELSNEEEIDESINQKSSIDFPLAQMEDFPDHKFATYEGQRLDDMVESIKTVGVIEPILLWQHDDKYTILSGHNRKKAAVIAGLITAPVRIFTDLTLERATLIVGETNFRQRSFTDMKHSERAICLAEHYKAMKAQGIRNDITNRLENLDKSDNGAENQTCGKIEHGLKSRDKIGEEYNLNPRTVNRYIRIAEIDSRLLEYLDNNRLAFMAAYELSFVTDARCQQNIADYIYSGKKIGIEDSKKLREYYEKKKSLTEEEIEQVLSKPKRMPKKNTFLLKNEFLQKFFKGNESAKEMETIISLALDKYFQNIAENPKNGL
ncbi:MAG: ParB N-terminal domain-containing protein [Ruminococcaceae bacterium]|nr:ParB N-terminal domain-containing protein [Oscillospiraceae bacterium]